MTNAQKFWREHDIEGCHLIGRDSDGNIQFESIIRNYTSHFSNRDGKEEEDLELYLSDNKRVKWDLLNETFISSDIPDLRYEIKDIDDIDRYLWILSELEIISYEKLNFCCMFNYSAIQKEEFKRKISDLHYRHKQLREKLNDLLEHLYTDKRNRI